MSIGGILLGILVGFVIGWFFAKSRKSLEDIAQNPLVLEVKNNLRSKESENEKLQNEKATLLLNLGKAESSILGLQENLTNQKNEFENMRKSMKEEFENLAQKILEKNSEKFSVQHQERLDNLLKPFKERIKDFEAKVDMVYKTDGEERVVLKTHLKQLMDLNQQLSKDAHNLTQALKGDSKTQGDWGEYRLEMILEKVGLTKGTHFDTQSTFRDDEGSLKKPDFIVHLPDNKHLIIDSKVSLTAYEKFCNHSEEGKAGHLKNHIDSLRQHVKGLSLKNYQQLYDIQTPDYVLMYVPIEPAFNVAVQEDEQLITEALERNIVIVTTSTLMATMKTVSFIWKQEYQKNNVQEIARQGAALYDKFVSFTENLIKIGRQMDTAKGSYEEAMKQLSTGRGNLINRAQNMKTLGIETSKKFDDALADRALNQKEV